jgi:3'-phosphoadenosine 5'-phosphosulfate sulfotransferase (PAPS reductase)/FAD synthetase
MKYVVGFSGGIDSQACALWCRNNFPPEDVILLNSDVGGHEHPITTAFIEEYSRTHHPVVVVSPQVQDMGNRAKAAIEARGLQPTDPLTFPLLAELKGMWPCRTKQFCTEYLKLNPAARWCMENLHDRGIEFERYVGVRRDESTSRRDYPDRFYDDLFMCWVNAPIVNWSKDQAFAYVKEHGERHNPLYGEGFGRVGCAPCVNSGKDDIRRWAAYHPEMIDKIREWEERVGKTFFTTNLPGRAFGDIDTVVDWSRTVRGGKQFALPIVEAEADEGLCQNKWGFCE